jgi:hypothetical protein
VRVRPLAAAALALALLTGCAQSVDPIERLGRKAAQEVRPHVYAARPVRSYRRWGLPAPLPRAPRPTPAPAPRPTGTAPPPVVTRVPTHDPVVFLTYDDTAERDARFGAMVRELRLPVSVFPADHGRPTRPSSVRTVLRGLPYGRQRAGICGRPGGLRSRLFRPPRGAYDTGTLRAAADCGVGALVLWRATMTAAGRLTYRHAPHRLCPGDIVSVAPDEGRGPSLTRRTSRLLARVEERGLTVGRLEDYL